MAVLIAYAHQPLMPALSLGVRACAVELRHAWVMANTRSEPSLTARPPWRTLVDAVAANAQSHPGTVVAEQWNGNEFTNQVTAQGLYQHIRAVAAGLIAAGVRVGDRVGIMSRTRYEWTVLDFAIWHAGAITVPIY